MGETSTALSQALRKLERPLALHERIQIERVVAGLNANHCSRAMGWKHHHIWQRVESGERQLTDLELAKVARLLGVTVTRLRGRLRPESVPGWVKRGRPRKVLAA